MLRSFKNRVAKLEGYLGRKRGAPIIIVNQGETREQALEKHFREHPDDREAEFFIIIHLSQEEETERSGGNPVDALQNHQKAQSRARPAESGARVDLTGKSQEELNNLTLAAQESAKQAEEGSDRPLKLDRNLPFESWDGLLCQQGVWFHKETLQAVNPDAPLPVQPEKLDIRERRTPIIWKGESCYLQNGWLFSQSTHEAIKS